MGFSNRRKKEAVEFRIFEEKVYELVAAEIESGDRRTGLWARALANSDGDEVKASGLYIKYRAQSLLDEAVLEMDVLEKVVDGQEVEVEEKGGVGTLFWLNTPDTSRRDKLFTNRGANHEPETYLQTVPARI